MIWWTELIYSHWLVTVRSLELLGSVSLVFAEEVWSEDDVSWLVDTVDVSETSGNREAWGDGRERLVDVPDVLRLSVKRGVVDVGVVNTILLTTGDTNLHLEPDFSSTMVY